MMAAFIAAAICWNDSRGVMAFRKKEKPHPQGTDAASGMPEFTAWSRR
jgi:hypothetical protein